MSLAAVPVSATHQERTRWLSRHWFHAFILLWGTFVAVPWLAPVLMRLGWVEPARLIYFAYSFVCHQLPERSWFLFGRSASYPLAVIQGAWRNTVDPLVLRQFIGNPTMGYKVAWSDRMVSMYTSIPLAALIWWSLRRKMRPMSVLAFVLLALPMALDGGTHMLSDFAAFGMGFRDTNVWLAALTHNALPAWFYAGDALGSFNSWMRLITGTLFGLGAAWFVMPYLQDVFGDPSSRVSSDGPAGLRR
jgi:uncharacterized membrane protein